MIALLLASLLTQNSVIVQQGRARDGGVPWAVAIAGTQTVGLEDYGKTAFGLARVAMPYTLADITTVSGFDATDVFATNLDGGSVTHLPDESSVLLQGPYAALRTNDQYRYQAGKGQRVLQTGGIPTALDAGVYRWGLFDNSDGLFWQGSSAGLHFVVRSSTDGGVTETAYAVDAGVAWVPSYESIWEIRFQWLGVGQVDGYLNGDRVFTHSHANVMPFPYIKTAFLPLSWDVRSTGVTDAQLKFTCASVQSEGGSDPSAVPFSITRPIDLSISGSATDIPVLSLRPAATFNSKINRSQIMPIHFWCVADSKRVRVRVLLNPSALTGAAFTTVSSLSAAEYDVTATGLTGGTELNSFAVPSGGFTDHLATATFSETRRHLRRRAFAAPTGAGLETGLDTIVLAVTNPGSGNATVNCGVEFSEVR
jgi:hypothetical protein